ncbi:MAG: hypothetical protein IPK82_09090 [Polyangiaceae bacterium]|nr:hypothetical protein [Polyangiaceae bacterium]
MNQAKCFRGSLSISALALSLSTLAFGCGSAGVYSSGGKAGAPPAYEAQGYPQSAPAAAGQAAKEAPAADASERPGLGTQWGEQRNSSITSVAFQRGDASNPFATTVLYYNDEEGAKAMASSSGFARTAAGMYPVANGALQIGLRDENGAWLSGFKASSKNYVVGEAGRRYTIVVKNATPFRIECVLSVDGLDVLDGKPASFSKRGYLVDPRSEIEVDGFRTSTTQVAAFRFGSVRGSYAEQKYGDSSNVGVIGLAVFHERGTEPWKWNEVERRHDANPFPGQFATPPGVAK